MEKTEVTERTENQNNGEKSAEELQKMFEEASEQLGMGDLPGWEVGPDTMPFQQKLGVLQRIVTAVSGNKEYRQILLLAAFDNKQEALLASDAIAERQRYGVDITPILDRIVAQCSVKSERVMQVLRAMTTYNLHTNYTGGLPSWKKKQESRNIT